MLPNLFFGFFSWKLSLMVFPLLLMPHSSPPSFPFLTPFPTPHFHPRQMAISHLLFLQGNEKFYEGLHLLPSPPAVAQSREQIGMAESLCLAVLPPSPHAGFGMGPAVPLAAGWFS